MSTKQGYGAYSAPVSTQQGTEAATASAAAVSATNATTTTAAANSTIAPPNSNSGAAIARKPRPVGGAGASSASSAENLEVQLQAIIMMLQKCAEPLAFLHPPASLHNTPLFNSSNSNNGAGYGPFASNTAAPRIADFAKSNSLADKVQR